jgi:endo-1,4-beta-xylanase
MREYSINATRFTGSAKAGLLAAACLVLPMLVSAQTPADTLRKLATSRGIHVGAAVTFPSGNNAANRPEYERVLKNSFNGLVAENAMKFQNLSNARGTYNFGPADAIADFADSNDMVLRGHTFVWHSQTANWFNNLSGTATSRDTTLKIMKQHIDTLGSRYRGRVLEWDVLNEAIAQSGGTSPNYRTGGSSRWYDRVGGIEYADSAFKWAQQVDSNALLYYNDFGAEGMNNKSTNVYDLVTGLKSRGAPIHGVGLQCHFSLTDHDTTTIGQNMRRLAALGFTISMTEIDISASTSTQNLESQKARYKALAKLCLDVPACKSFYAWGVNDNQSWRGANAAALLFSGTSTLAPKPAFWGVVEALNEGSTATSAPSMPWNVVVTRGPLSGPFSLTVRWRAPVTDGRSPITSYKAVAVSDTAINCTTNGATSCTIVTGLTLADTNLRFIVRATNAVGTSGASPPSPGTGSGTVAPPGRPVYRILHLPDSRRRGRNRGPDEHDGFGRLRSYRVVEVGPPLVLVASRNLLERDRPLRLPRPGGRVHDPRACGTGRLVPGRERPGLVARSTLTGRPPARSPASFIDA